MTHSFPCRFASFVAFSSLLGVVACSSSNSGSTNNGGGAQKPANATWCGGTAAAAGCQTVDVCGVCTYFSPTANLLRTTDTREYAGTGNPDVSCDTPATTKPLGTSKNVKIEAWVKIFANGPDSKNVKIDVYKEQITGGVQTGALGDPVGSTTSVDSLPDGTATKTETIEKSGTAVTRTLYPFELDGVPTETPLVVKTSSKTSVDVDGWFVLYDYNIVILDADPKCASDADQNCWVSDGVYRYYPRALGNDDYASILRAAYSRAPSGGKGAVAGEVHDCGDVRLSNATVGVNGTSRGLGMFYLSEDQDNPLPDGNRHATGKLGLYADGELDPGTYTIAAAGKDANGTLTALGTYTVQVFPDSVSALTFRGLRSWQIPSK